MERKFKIYGLYDLSENLRYIGYTSNKLRIRFNGHLTTARKSGKKNHRECWIISMLNSGHKPVMKLIEECDTIEEAHDREIYWIKYHRDCGIDLVNSTDGGDGTVGFTASDETKLLLSKAVNQFTKEGILIKTHVSLSEASLAVSGTKRYNGKISGVCNGKRGRRTFLGFVWRYEGDDFNTHPVDSQWNVTQNQRDNLSQRQTVNNCMKGKPALNRVIVQQLDDNGNIVETFSSRKEASIRTGVSESCIGESKRKGCKRGGYYWKYK